jgi:catechol 2,3-dioxygenase-like lactoylglutathione lyase family enzyme
MISRLAAFFGGLLLVAPLAFGAPSVDGVERVVIPVSRPEQAGAFYIGALNFAPVEDAAGRHLLRLDAETIELVQSGGRPIPADSRSNDGWFQHLAIVVSDINAAYARVRQAGAAAISVGPQSLPQWNPYAGGIRAVYFRDPDGHPLELIQYPLGKGDPRWHVKSRLFLGIDHTAIASSNTERSLAFYRDRLGLRIAGTSENWGIEQERLSAVPRARVRITTLRGGRGPGIELLDYLVPRDGRPMPPNTTPNDLWAEVVVLHAASVAVVGETLRDPDGHALRVVGDRLEAAR